MGYRTLAWRILLVAGILIPAPLLGAWLSNQPIDQYLQFPPLTVYVSHAGFSWLAFGLLLVIEVPLWMALLLPHLRASGPRRSPIHLGRFAWWGWLGMVLILSGWALAWTRLAWFAPFQQHTFTPIWLGYILFVNALSLHRSGRCLLIAQPRLLLSLFPLSALFWWFFEYLNRFVQNWYYLGVEDFGTWAYALHASLAFSTVLPAVLSTTEYFYRHEAFARPYRHGPLLQRPIPAIAGWLLLAAGVFGMAGLARWPSLLYPLVWVAPLMVLLAAAWISRQPGVFAPLRQGDWRPVALPALAALSCGFFWELWNWHSLAHWEYAVPYVQAFHLFEMPALGYAGYLPFGLECLLVVALLPRGASFIHELQKIDGQGRTD